jgi:hypothetical protein
MKNLAASYQRHLSDARIHWRSEDVRKLAAVCEMSVDAVVHAISERSLYRAAPPSTVAAPLRKGEGGSARYTFNISSATPDRMGDVVVQEGVVTAAFGTTPLCCGRTILRK